LVHDGPLAELVIDRDRTALARGEGAISIRNLDAAVAEVKRHSWFVKRGDAE
jgi:hypothetical protein